jgi:hypothetical protein
MGLIETHIVYSIKVHINEKCQACLRNHPSSEEELHMELYDRCCCGVYANRDVLWVRSDDGL